MANITKRANKRCAEHLGGELAEVALLCEMRGMLGFGMVGGVLASRTTDRVLRDRTATTLDGQGGIASSFPPAPRRCSSRRRGSSPCAATASSSTRRR